MRVKIQKTTGHKNVSPKRTGKIIGVSQIFIINFGDKVKLRETPKALSTKIIRKLIIGSDKELRYGNNLKDKNNSFKWAIRSQVLKPNGHACSSTTKWLWAKLTFSLRYSLFPVIVFHNKYPEKEGSQGFSLQQLSCLSYFSHIYYLCNYYTCLIYYLSIDK